MPKSAGWRVVPDATLGLFSFLKLLMYHDLDRAGAAAEAHPILSMLAGQSQGLETGDWKLGKAPAPTTQSPASSPQSAVPSLDSRPPEDCFQVLDADSSQADAIAAA